MLENNGEAGRRSWQLKKETHYPDRQNLEMGVGLIDPEINLYVETNGQREVTLAKGC